MPGWVVYDKKGRRLRYPKPYQKNFNRIAQAFRDEGFVVEGFTEGSMGVAHRKGDDLPAVLEEAGVDTTDITFHENW